MFPIYAMGFSEEAAVYVWRGSSLATSSGRPNAKITFKTMGQDIAGKVWTGRDVLRANHFLLMVCAADGTGARVVLPDLGSTTLHGTFAGPNNGSYASFTISAGHEPGDSDLVIALLPQ